MHTPAKRSGFTLIELLVVMGILAILMGLGFVFVTSFVTNSREAATEVTLKKVDAVIQDRLTQIQNYFELRNKVDKGRNGRFFRTPGYVMPESQIIAFTEAIENDDQQLLKILDIRARKDFTRRFLPMSFEEADTNLDGATDVKDLMGNPVDVALLASIGHDPDTESSEVLYWALSQPMGVEPVGTLDFTDREVRDTDGDGLLEFVDGWGQPLRFYRWPTRLIRQPVSGDPTETVSDFSEASINTAAAHLLIGTVPNEAILGDDPDDPLSILPTAYSPAVFEKNFHTLKTWHAPLVVSIGEDGKAGLYEPYDQPNFGQLAQPESLPDLEDNFSNLALRTGGK